MNRMNRAMIATGMKRCMAYAMIALDRCALVARE